MSVSQDSLGHWAAHARLERFRGRLDDARKVYQTVLASPPSVTCAGTSILWWDWAEMEWLSGASDAALRVILRAVNIEGSSGIMILRAKQSLEENYSASRGLGLKERERWLRLRGLLELLSSSAEAALVTLDDSLLNHDDFVEGSVAHESLLVASLLIIYHNGTTLRNPSPPSLLRDRLEAAVKIYPSNSIILAMFLETEKGQGVWGRVRGLLGESDKVEKDVYRRVAEVWVGARWEKSRWETEREKIRSGLVAAVDNERFVVICEDKAFLILYFTGPEEVQLFVGYSLSLRFMLVSHKERRGCSMGLSANVHYRKVCLSIRFTNLIIYPLQSYIC